MCYRQPYAISRNWYGCPLAYFLLPWVASAFWMQPFFISTLTQLNFITMEKVTITHRITNNRNFYYKRFDEYELNSVYGRRITKEEYEWSKFEHEIISNNEYLIGCDNVRERLTYYN